MVNSKSLVSRAVDLLETHQLRQGAVIEIEKYSAKLGDGWRQQ
jgi:hypothetical protein